jgi:hypothetical protein
MTSTISDIEADLRKLANAFFENLGWDYNQPYYRTIGLDSKRPFGNQDMEKDILEIIGAYMEGDNGEEPCYSSRQREYAETLYEKLLPWLKNKYGSEK